MFHYYGAGQVGPMEFVRGNLALRDHSENGEEVHLFEQVSGGLRYDGQMVCAGYYERDDVADRNGRPCGARSCSSSSRSTTSSRSCSRSRSGESRARLALDDAARRAPRAAHHEPSGISRTPVRQSYARMSGARTCACTCDAAPTGAARGAGRRRRSRPRVGIRTSSRTTRDASPTAGRTTTTTSSRYALPVTGASITPETVRATTSSSASN